MKRLTLRAIATAGIATCLVLLIEVGATHAEATGPEPAGWYAGDMHVHRSCGDAPEPITNIYNDMASQDLAIVSLLADMGSGEVQDAPTDLPCVTGQDDPISTTDRILHWDAEWHWDATYTQYPHQALGGHVVALKLTHALPIWEEYTYPIFAWAHQQQGIAGFVHMQYLTDAFPTSLNCCIPIEYPVEVALGACDFIAEDVSGSDSAMRAYYRLLNCGFRPGLAAGTDHPCGQVIGPLLTYVQVGAEPLTYGNWVAGIAGGRTTVSRNGRNEFLALQVNGSATPGDEVLLAGAGNVSVEIQWTAMQALTGTIELVQNGQVVASRHSVTVAPGAPAGLSTTVNFTKSGWLCARRMSGRGHETHTSAVFVLVNNRPIRASADDAYFYAQWIDQLLTHTSLPDGVWRNFFINSRDAAQARYLAASSIYQQIAAQANDPQSVIISTRSIPNGFLHTPYAAALTANGGNLPYTWAATGALPPGLTLDSSSGAINGTPMAIGAFSFTVQVSDAGNPVRTASNVLNITITSASPTFTQSPTVSPTMILTITTQTPTVTVTVTHTRSHTPTDIGSHTPTHTPSNIGSHTPTHTPSDIGSHTPTHTPSDIGSHTPTHTPSDIGSHTPTDTPSHTPTWIITQTSTQRPTRTETALIDLHPTQTISTTSRPAIFPNNEIKIYPNPCEGKTATFQFQSEIFGPVEIVIHNVTGRLVSRLEVSIPSPGIHTVQYSTAKLATGIYLVNIRQAGKSLGINRLVVKRPKP